MRPGLPPHPSHLKPQTSRLDSLAVRMLILYWSRGTGRAGSSGVPSPELLVRSISMTETNQCGEASKVKGLDERGLLTACCRREAGAWERFLAQYSRLIYYSIHRTCLLRHYQAAPDEVADLFN